VIFTQKKYGKVRILSVVFLLRTVLAISVLLFILAFFLLGIGDSGHHTPDFGAKRNQERSTGPSTGSHLYSDMLRILVSSGRSRVADPDPHYFGKPLQDPY
jgi:hypothetical protein